MKRLPVHHVVNVDDLIADAASAIDAHTDELAELMTYSPSRVEEKINQIAREAVADMLENLVGPDPSSTMPEYSPAQLAGWVRQIRK